MWVASKISGAEGVMGAEVNYMSNWIIFFRWSNLGLLLPIWMNGCPTHPPPPPLYGILHSDGLPDVCIR